MKCPNCAGTLYFDIQNQNLKCRSCSASFEVNEYQKDNSARQIEFEGGRLYTCQNCGAELISGDAQAVTYCSYCGSQAIMEGELSGINEPVSIIPFQVTKKECKKIYEKAVGRKLFVPAQFKDPEFIEKFRPFYIPYWLYHIRFRDDVFTMDASKSYTSGDYDYYETYKINAQIRDNGLYGIPYDASRNFDDSIAEDIAPFSKKKMVPYNPAYLAGMYADAPNVDPQTYREEVMESATRQAFADIADSAGNVSLKMPSRGKQQQFLQTTYAGEDAVFLPVWFLTWKNKDRVAYAVVNGQTGKIHVDLPVDFRQFALYTLAGAAVLFILLSLFLTVTSRFVLWFAALLVYLCGRRYRKELTLIRDRENHVFDKGYLFNEKNELHMSPKKRDRLRRKAENTFGGFSSFFRISFLSFLFIFVFAFFSALYDELVSQRGAQVITFLLLLPELISFIRTFMVVIHLSKKRSLLIAFLGLLAVIYAFVVASLEPVMDYWYYTGALIALTASALMCIDMMARYNETSTRPLPSFYSRKGGNDRAKDL